jgi:hypothetical protein
VIFLDTYQNNQYLLKKVYKLLLISREMKNKMKTHYKKRFYERMIREQNEYDKNWIKGIAITGAIFAIGYYIHNKDIQITDFDQKKPLNNIEAILVADNRKKFTNTGIKIKNTNRSDSKKIIQKKYSKFTHNNYNHNNKKIQIPIKVNEYASNNTSYKFFPNDRRYVERYTLRDW